MDTILESIFFLSCCSCIFIYFLKLPWGSHIEGMHILNALPVAVVSMCPIALSYTLSAWCHLAGRHCTSDSYRSAVGRMLVPIAAVGTVIQCSSVLGFRRNLPPSALIRKVHLMFAVLILIFLLPSRPVYLTSSTCLLRALTSASLPCMTELCLPPPCWTMIPACWLGTVFWCPFPINSSAFANGNYSRGRKVHTPMQGLGGRT